MPSAHRVSDSSMKPRPAKLRVARGRNASVTRGVTVFEATTLAALCVVLGVGGFGWLAHRQAHAATDSARAGAEQLQRAALRWLHASEGEGCPTTEQLVHEGFLEREASAVADPWGGRYRLSCGADAVVVLSAGPDSKLSTPDDVRYPTATSMQP